MNDVPWRRTTRSLLLVSCLAGAGAALSNRSAHALPEVSVFAPAWATTEPCPVCRVVPAVLVVQRMPPAREPLVVFLEADGTATPGEDYPALPGRVEIPAGRDAVEVRLGAFDDLLVEGPEVVRVRLVPAPGYLVRPYAGEALVVIGDDEPGAPEARLDIVEPRDGAQFPLGAGLRLSAIGVDLSGEVYGPVEFYSGKELIGQAPVHPVARPPIPGLPSVHSIDWVSPAAGEHLLTARTQLGLDVWIVSPPVRIAVAPEPLPTVVGIEATRLIAEESAYPYRRMNLVGEFTIFRAGPTDAALPVFVQYSGSAIVGEDCPPLPWRVSIPAGAAATAIRVEAIPDSVPEGIETLVATISNCPPEMEPPLGMPCYGFDVEPARERATVFLRDDGITQASLTITKPEDGAEFGAAEAILIEATAIDLDGYISHVEFYDGDRRIGESNIAFFVAPPPGTPIHHSFEWRDAAPGAHLLRARAEGSLGQGVTSPPVHITVRRLVNEPPHIAITRPAPGAEFPPEWPIEIAAEACDPDGYVPKVEFLADGRKIGEQSVRFFRVPDPGQTQTFVFVWRLPMPGPHRLEARATDSDGATALSAPVEIRVALPERLPVVTVFAADPFAVEPSLDTPGNPATFRICRFGPTTDALVVNYSVHGTAQEGVDYEALSGQATILAEQRSVAVTVRPLPDDLVEGIETVVLRLEPPPADQDPTYRLGLRRRAAALISDRRPSLSPEGARCAPVGSGLVHVCFGAETGRGFRVEASTDLRNWETVGDAVATDGMVDFVDEDAASFPSRFYRLAPEPLVEGED